LIDGPSQPFNLILSEKIKATIIGNLNYRRKSFLRGVFNYREMIIQRNTAVVCPTPELRIHGIPAIDPQ
jgi:hypothetical protein